MNVEIDINHIMQMAIQAQLKDTEDAKEAIGGCLSALANSFLYLFGCIEGIPLESCEALTETTLNTVKDKIKEIFADKAKEMN